MGKYHGLAAAPLRPGQPVIAAVAVNLENAIEALEDPFGMDAAAPRRKVEHDAGRIGPAPPPVVAGERDAYPGVNLLTLIELREPPDPDRLKLLPIVRYAAECRLASDRPDFQPETTAHNLRLIREARQGREEGADPIRELETELERSKTAASET